MPWTVLEITKLNNTVPASRYLKFRKGDKSANRMSKSTFMINLLSSGYAYWKRLSLTVSEILHSEPRRSALIFEEGI